MAFSSQDVPAFLQPLAYRAERFWIDSRNIRRLQREIDTAPRPPAFMFGFSAWKQAVIRNYLPEHHCLFLSPKTAGYAVRFLLRRHPAIPVVIWGCQEPDWLTRHLREQAVTPWRIEDGFIRSVGLGAQHIPPLSLVIDRQGIYFNAQQPSALEDILNRHPFEDEPELLARAQGAMQVIRDKRLSKYNQLLGEERFSYGEKTRPRILVVGQVEDDASIRFGCPEAMTNNDLVRLAAREHPEAEIIYKPHPDVLQRHRERYSDPAEVAHLARILTEPLNTPEALNGIDHVYTLTSLVGMEALIRGIPVTCVGMPFYAGWGLTDDRMRCERRQRGLSLEALFAGAYLLYPTYREWDGTPTTLENALDRLDSDRTLLSAIRAGESSADRLSDAARQAYAGLLNPR